VLASTPVKYLIVLLGCLAAGMVVYSLGSLLGRRSERLSFALRHYDGMAPASHSGMDSDLDLDDDGSLAKGAVMKRAVQITGDLAQRQGLLTRVETMLEQADLPLRPAEALFFYCGIVVIATAGSALLSGNPLMILFVVLLALVAPRFFVSFRAGRRAKKFVTQLPDMLNLLAGTLRAGYSIGQGFEAVSKEVDGPMGQELRRIMAEARLGRPLEEALDAAAERVKSDDFAWAVKAIRIQREVGGNLAELLITVADTMTQRERLRRDVSSLTAEGRMSAIVLGCLPPGLGAVMMVMNAEYISKLFEETMGLFLIGGAVVAMLIGFAWMKKIVTIEI
jgi:tight adherence protein B